MFGVSINGLRNKKPVFFLVEGGDLFLENGNGRKLCSKGAPQ